MAGSTSRGLPYPSGTDKVRGGAAAIQALAEAVDPLLVRPFRAQLGTAGISVGGGGVWTRLACPTDDGSNGGGTTLGGTGPVLTASGIWRVTAYVTWPTTAATGGERLIGVCTTAQSTPGWSATDSQPGRTAQIYQSLTADLAFAAGDQVSIMANSTAGTAMTVTTRRISVQRIS